MQTICMTYSSRTKANRCYVIKVAVILRLGFVARAHVLFAHSARRSCPSRKIPRDLSVVRIDNQMVD